MINVLQNQELALEVLSRDLGIFPIPKSVLSNEVMSEIIRSGAIALASRKDPYREMQPFYISELLNVVCDQIFSLSKGISESGVSEIEDQISSTVRLLADIGDLAELENGYWLPTPFRLVKLEADKAIVLGTLTAASIYRSLKLQILNRGLLRFVKIGELTCELQSSNDIWQNFDDWLGERPNDLSLWLSSYCSYAQANLKLSASNFSDFEIYDPKSSARSPQFFRWKRSQDFRVTSDKVYLCRLGKTRFRTTASYCLAQLTSDRTSTKILREFSIPSKDARRLQYCIDVKENCPVIIALKQLSDSFIVTLKSWLPSEGMRILTALGKEISPIPGRFPLSYEFDSSFFSKVNSYFNYLGVRIERQGHND